MFRLARLYVDVRTCSCDLCTRVSSLYLSANVNVRVCFVIAGAAYCQFIHLLFPGKAIM